MGGVLNRRFTSPRTPAVRAHRADLTSVGAETTSQMEYTVANDKTVHTVRTKLNKDDKSPIITALTINWAGATADLLRAPAADSLIITWQGQMRRSKKIPAQAEFLATDFIARMGSRQGPVTAESVAAMAATLKPEEVEAMIAKLRAEQKAREAADKAAAKAPDAKNKGFRAPPKGGDGGSAPTP